MCINLIQDLVVENTLSLFPTAYYLSLEESTAHRLIETLPAMFSSINEQLSRLVSDECHTEGQEEDFARRLNVVGLNVDPSAGSANVHDTSPCDDKNIGWLTTMQQTQIDPQQTGAPTTMESSTVPRSIDSLKITPIGAITSTISSATSLAAPAAALPTPPAGILSASLLPILNNPTLSTSDIIIGTTISDIVTTTTTSPSILTSTVTMTTMITSGSTTVIQPQTSFVPSDVTGELPDSTMDSVSTAEASVTWTTSSANPSVQPATQSHDQVGHKTVKPLAIILPIVFSLLFICGLLIWWLVVRRREKKRRDHLTSKAEWFNDDHINHIRQKMKGLDPEKTGASGYTPESLSKLDKSLDSSLNLPSPRVMEGMLGPSARNRSSQLHGPGGNFNMRPSQIESAAADLSNQSSLNSSRTDSSKSLHVDVPRCVRRASSPGSSTLDGLNSSSSHAPMPVHSRVASGIETTISRHASEQNSETHLLNSSSARSSASESGYEDPTQTQNINQDQQEQRRRRRRQSDIQPLRRKSSISSNLSAKQTLSHKLNRGFERAMRRRNGLEQLNSRTLDQC